jgi:hypothetical protein
VKWVCKVSDVCLRWWTKGFSPLASPVLPRGRSGDEFGALGVDNLAQPEEAVFLECVAS